MPPHMSAAHVVNPLMLTHLVPAAIDRMPQMMRDRMPEIASIYFLKQFT